MAVTRKRRARSQNGTGDVTNLKTLVDSLIKENRSLKRQLARLEATSTERGSGSNVRRLKTIARRLERVLNASGTTTSGRRRTSASLRSRSRTTTAPKTRKPTSPETKQKGLQR
jgi:hypothetical protein